MSHYVNCPTLFAVLSFMCDGVTHLHDTVSSDPLQRLGVVNPNLWKLKMVACSFSAYHAVKFNFGGLFCAEGPHSHCTSLPNMLHLSILRSFADVFSAEAHEVGVPTRCFDLEAFEHFLASGELPQRLPVSDLTRDPSQLPANRTLTGSRMVHVSSARSPDISFAPATDANAQNPVLHQAHSGTG